MIGKIQKTKENEPCKIIIENNLEGVNKDMETFKNAVIEHLTEVSQALPGIMEELRKEYKAADTQTAEMFTNIVPTMVGQAVQDIRDTFAELKIQLAAAEQKAQEALDNAYGVTETEVLGMIEQSTSVLENEIENLKEQLTNNSTSGEEPDFSGAFFYET